MLRLLLSLRCEEIDLFKSLAHDLSMKSNAIRTSIDLPRDLNRRVFPGGGLMTGRE